MTMAHVGNERPMSNGCENNGDTMLEPMDLSAPMPNGTQTKAALNFDGQLSPASLRRRSTRASALKAQEKIKLKDDLLGVTSNFEQEDLEEESGESPPKKRRLQEGSAFDQFSHKFGLREHDGNVYPLTDESEVSSLHDSEVITLKASYDKLMSKELTPEQKHERTLMIKQCEAELRLEEAKLMMLKKVKASQMLASQKIHEAKKGATLMPVNNTSGAYKPLVAPPLNKSASTPANGKNSSSSSRTNPVLGLAGLTAQQQQELLRSAQANPAALQALLMQAAKNGQSPAQALAALFATHSSTSAATPTAQQVKEQRAKEEQLLKEQAAAATQASTAAQQAKLLAAQTPQQRAATARQAFRMQADKQLMQQITAPKAPPIDLFFIPNGSQPDFCYLVGLDLVVQRVLKDRNVYRSVTEGPYECEECGTDFTPSWKAIGTSASDMHLYCEQCVRTAQKLKIRTDHSNVLRKAYNKINSQEREFEKQIADGKLEAALAAAAQAHAAAAAAAAAASSGASTSQAQNLSTKAHTNSVQSTSHRSGTSTPTTRKAATPVPQSTTPQLPKVGAASSSSTTNTPSLKKSSSTPGLNMAAMQQQMAAMQQLVRANPMMAMAASQMAGAAAAGNPMASMMQQMWNPMMLQAAATQMRLQQQQAQQQASQPNMAMSMLAQAVQHAQSSGISGQNNTAIAQLAAAAAMNPALMNNPQLLRQIQQMQGRGLIESLRGKK
ncbi:hypothetical protein Q1695_009135 [Nippostrongylus brasiliensis]|nr:hypothetical protein Q1695_009135 [Nippostrongylus brasiliensis]